MAWQTPKTNWASADVPAPSDFNRIEGNAAELKSAIDTHKFAPVLDHPDGSVTTAKLADGSVTDAKIGSRTINDTSVPSGNTGTLTSLLGWLAYMIKAITGKSSWRTAPATTLEAAAAHIANTNNPHGVTKSQVGLGNVQNYGIASQAQAEAGSANNVYMTPLRTKQAIDQFVPIETGTWTPNVQIGGFDVSFASRSGNYTRIGNLLYWSFHVELSSKNSGTGRVAVGAFPFPLAYQHSSIAVGILTNAYLPSGANWVSLRLERNGATYFWLELSGYVSKNTPLTESHIANNTVISASGVSRIWT